MSGYDPDSYLNDTTSQQQSAPYDPDSYLQDNTPARHVQSMDIVNGKEVPTGSPEARAAQSPVSGMSDLERFMAGAGKAPVSLWRGIRQIAGIHGTQDEIDEAAKLDRPLMNTTAGLAGNIAGNVAMATAPVGLAADAAGSIGLARTAGVLGAIANPGTIGAAIGSGAVQGALQPVETGGSRAFNTVVGGVFGAGGNILARGASAAKAAIVGQMEDAGSRSVQALANAGVPLDAAQRTGSVLLNRAKAMLSDNPLTAGAQADFEDMQKKAITRAFLKTTGADGLAATPDVMGRNMERLGNQYDALFEKLQLPYDKVEAQLSSLVDNARLNLNDTQFGVIKRNAEDILNKAAANNGVIGGQQFQNIKTTLDKISRGGDQQVGDVARDLRETLHEGLLQHATDTGDTASVQALKTTNQQWRNMRTLEGAISTDGHGMISPARVATVMAQKANRSVSIYGKGDTSLADLAHAANDLLPNRTPNSGTMARIAAQSTLPLVGAAIEAGREKKWKGALKGAAVGVAIPKAAQALINSQGGISRAASNAIAAFAGPPGLPMAVGGALQHLPQSAMEAADEAQGKPQQ